MPSIPEIDGLSPSVPLPQGGGGAKEDFSANWTGRSRIALPVPSVTSAGTTRPHRCAVPNGRHSQREVRFAVWGRTVEGATPGGMADGKIRSPEDPVSRSSFRTVKQRSRTSRRQILAETVGRLMLAGERDFPSITPPTVTGMRFVKEESRSGWQLPARKRRRKEKVRTDARKAGGGANDRAVRRKAPAGASWSCTDKGSSRGRGRTSDKTAPRLRGGGRRSVHDLDDLDLLVRLGRDRDAVSGRRIGDGDAP